MAKSSKKKLEYQRLYNLRNREKLNKQKRQRRLKNPEKIQFQRRTAYYKKRGRQPGDIRHKVYEEAALSFLQERGFEPRTNVSVRNVECTETGTHRYPDARFWCKGFALIVEIDEHAHRGVAYDCDFRRMAEICACLSAPVWYVRYKPDAPDSNLEELAEKVRSIQELEKPEWEFLNFSVDYMFYNEGDMKVARERKIAAMQLLQQRRSGQSSV